MNIEKADSRLPNKKFKKCHRIGHDLIFGINAGEIVKVCKKCGLIWTRHWIKDMGLTTKNLEGKIDFTKYDEISEKQVIENEVKSS